VPPRTTRLTAFGEPEEPAAPSGEPLPVTRAEDAEPPARSVTEVVAEVNGLLAPGFSDVWVRGEISGFKAAASGHWYFDLKDEKSILKGAMFRGSNFRVKFRPEEGMEVLARGRVSVYPERAQLQIVVQEIRPVGVGGLALAFEQLKARLAAEGLFDETRKRALPRFARTIGIVTSLNAAALRDMVHVATRRNPAVRLLVCDARVQGEGAADEVARGIARLNARDDVDVIIVGRGGGSIEDLWAFNEEAVVRAVAGSRIPVVSAVGHETDFTLCDFAADHRAATPSAAAETLVPEAAAILEWLDDQRARLQGALARLVPDTRRHVDERMERMEGAMRRLVDHERELLAARAARLDALSPLGVLARGYAVVQREGRVVRAVADAPTGADVTIILRNGRLRATVRETPEESP
jgi:exodeoxyribonuclease VII large subunit